MVDEALGSSPATAAGGRTRGDQATPGGAVPERPSRPPARTTGLLSRVPRIASLVLTVAAVVSAATALSGALHHALAPVQDVLQLLLISAEPNLTSAAVWGV